MTTLTQIGILLRREIVAEWRDRYALGSVFLYVIATTVIVYLAMKDRLDAGNFNALYWIILFFGATVAAGRSFLREGGRRHYYFYTITSPEALLFSKIIFNTFVVWLIGALTWGLLSVFAAGNYVRFPGIFLLALLLGGIGLAVILSFVSALAARAGNNGTLMAVLSFPLVVPLLKLVVDAGTYAIDGGIGDPYQPLVLTVAVDLLAIAVATVLFPFIWRD